MKYDSEVDWYDNNNAISESEIYRVIEDYVKQGGIIYIGSDSMLRNNVCRFASVIAIHSTKVAYYFHKKQSIKNKKYNSLQNKIFEEVDCSLRIAKDFSNYFPNAKIEVHVDVGKTLKSKTRIYIDAIKGWVNGCGFTCRVKPFSWASYIADWHSK